MIYPDLETVKGHAAEGKYRTIPVAMELYADRYTPIGVLEKLKASGSCCYMLESAENMARWGRYSFLGFAPLLEINCLDGKVCIRRQGGDGREERKQEGTLSPSEAVRQVIRENMAVPVEGMPPFTGGLVGYFAYDYIKYAEPSLLLTARDDAGFKDMDLMLFEQGITFDHLRQKMILTTSIRLDGRVEEAYREAEGKLGRLKELIRDGKNASSIPLKLKSDFQAQFSRKTFCRMVEEAKRYIREGDIFQVVLANRLQAEMEGSILDVYRALRSLNPSPYMFYFSGRDIELAGASPETLVRLTNRVVRTFPLAGTRRRGETEEEDAALEKELLADEKELAEHNMLVDLGRNDIGKVSRFGSVRLEKYKGIERFSHVMHIGSTVRGELREDKDYMDTLEAVLPAGTLSGAPKIRACQIIDELEGIRRGIYGGAVGYIDFTGNMDTCIAIRMAYARNGKLYICSGAGIVADSEPEKEYQECINKAQAVRTAVCMAERGLEA